MQSQKSKEGWRKFSENSKNKEKIIGLKKNYNFDIIKSLVKYKILAISNKSSN